MVADYFTKPLQGVIFRKLRAMIMGNSVIPLPSDPISIVKTNEIVNEKLLQTVIPPVFPRQESRSVLEIKNEDSPSVPVTHECVQTAYSSLTVLPSSVKSVASIARNAVANTVGDHTTSIVRKRTLTWAEVAGRNRIRKEWSLTLFTKFKLTKRLISDSSEYF